MKKRLHIIGVLAICISAISWGLDGVVLTPQLYNLDTSLVVFLLHFIPFMIMNLFLFKEYKHIKKFTKDDFITFSLIAIFGGALGTLAIVKALFLVKFNHLSVIILLQKLQPVFAIILASILLKEKIGKRFILWASIAIIASYFLAFGFHVPQFSSDNLAQAALWSLLAAFSFGSATVFGKKMLNRYSFHTTTFYRFGFTSLFMLVFTAITGTIFNIPQVTPFNWLIFLIIAFTTGCGAIFLYYYGLNKVKAIISTICELCFPVSTIIFDYLINGTVLSLIQWISAIIMVTSIIMISKGKKE